MLSVKNLVKVYKAKGGAETRALDGVSIDFPEKGMVFLLGKSGSGKSTLLNVAGGLDVPTSGEIIVKGKSSRDFTPSDFDSFRNTFIGFIFQEYNLLEEFNIEQNIALALQLQGKKSDAAEVDKLLELVDLKGFNKRKPNTLSGGQRQRVAIARALIKNPEIIMADEPTGALDSETGEQVFETLKKLSEDKLVIVVSHDREFAEEYADRIIELKDGKILSDITKEYDQSEFKGANVNILSDSTVRIKDCSKLSDEDVSEIIKAIKQKGGGEMIILSDENKLAEVKKVCDIKDEKSGGHFEKTDLEKTKPAIYDGKNTKFIKSKLPASHAIKIGASGLKTKPVRLAFTILLSVISFTLFGVLSAMMLYDPIYSIAVALQEENVETARLEKYYDYIPIYYSLDSNGNKINEEKGDYTMVQRTRLGKTELDELNDNEKGLSFAGVFDIKNDFSDNLINKTSKKYYYNYFKGEFSGFSDCGEEVLKKNGFTLLAGSYPKTANELAIPKYIYELFEETGFVGNDRKTLDISEPEDLIGKAITLRLIKPDEDYYSNGTKKTFTITGVYDVNELSAFSDLKKDDVTGIDKKELKTLKETFEEACTQGFSSLAFVSPEFYSEYSGYLRSYEDPVRVNTEYFYGVRMGSERYGDDTKVTTDSSVEYITSETVKDYQDYIDIYSVSGTVDKNNLSLAKTDVYIDLSHFMESVRELAFLEVGESSEMYCDKNPEFRQSLINATTTKAFKIYNKEIPEEELANAKPFTQNDFNVLRKYIEQDYKKYFGSVIYNFYDTQLENARGEKVTLTIKGYISMQNSSGVYLLSKELVEAYEVKGSDKIEDDNITMLHLRRVTDYVAPKDARYGYIITKTTNELDDVHFMLDKRGNYSYRMTNSTYKSVNWIAYYLKSFKLVFAIAGGVLAALSALMLFNFISASISAKTRDIGILRAVGGRGADVFKIFFSESSIIAAICFALSAICAGIACYFLNGFFVGSSLHITVLNYGFVEVALILGISLVVSLLATFIPVYFAAKRSPVESIRSL